MAASGHKNEATIRSFSKTDICTKKMSETLTTRWEVISVWRGKQDKSKCVAFKVNSNTFKAKTNTFKVTKYSVKMITNTFKVKTYTFKVTRYSVKVNTNTFKVKTYTFKVTRYILKVKTYTALK